MFTLKAKPNPKHANIGVGWRATDEQLKEVIGKEITEVRLHSNDDGYDTEFVLVLEDGSVVKTHDSSLILMAIRGYGNELIGKKLTGINCGLSAKSYSDPVVNTITITAGAVVLEVDFFLDKWDDHGPRIDVEVCTLFDLNEDYDV